MHVGDRRANVGVWLPSYIERLALAPLESVAETMRVRVGVRSSLRRSFKDKLGWKPAIILSRKDWHCVQDREVVWWPRPGTEDRLDLPRRLRRQCGASVVTAAIVVANRMEDPVKLTDTQLLLLSAASQRDDRALEPSPKLTGGAAGKVVAKLLTEGLVEEVRARGSIPVWRRDDDGPRALRITKKGLQTIRVEDEPTDAAAGEPKPAAQRAKQS